MVGTIKNETKLIIAGQEFELIKYSCDLNDKWYCGELGPMIKKQGGTRTNPEIAKDSIEWRGASSGKENRQLEKLIFFAEGTIEYWKTKIKELYPVLESEKESNFAARLARAENGLKELQQLNKQRNFKNYERTTQK